MAELAARAARTGVAQVAWFLSPAEREQARICAQQAGVDFFSEGGTPDAERQVVAFAASDWALQWPIVCLEVTWHAKYGALGHRDLLGALMATGIERDRVGDIAVGEGTAHVFMLQEMGQYIAASLTKAGNVPVRVRLLTEWPQALYGSQATTMRVTVASLRLDALLGAAWHLSRTRAADLVRSGAVQVDHIPETRVDRQISSGAMLSVRGLGRVQVASIDGMTKKGRIAATLLRY